MNEDIQQAFLAWQREGEQLTRQSNQLKAKQAAGQADEAEAMQLAAQKKESRAQLQQICEAYVAAFTEEHINKSHGKLLDERARQILNTEMTRTIREMESLKKNKCVQRFGVFLEQGCAAFLSGCRVPAVRWDNEVKNALHTIMKREKLPQSLHSALFGKPYHQQLMDVVRSVMEQLYTKAVHGYSVRSLRSDVRRRTKLRTALGLAENNFDYRAKFARQTLLDYIPDDYADLYPAARTMERHFILHVGPTNSGKTYAAMQAMHHAKDGIYLAPLRLLAYEQFDSLNKDGIYCSLKTGEEHIEVPCATVQACTIEMMDERHQYDVVVIDEAQMVQDAMRGGHWTKAILGAWAKEIHVCLAPEAEQIVIRMINQCHDSYEIIRHERFTELVPDEVEHVHFPNQVEDGDAYIVFSRGSAHACVA
ncbi:MAG: hypothetical protein Q4C54_06940 [Clostridia bacterium]|nr:hypothetical protein [Clostridia bacterium]